MKYFNFTFIVFIAVLLLTSCHKPQPKTTEQKLSDFFKKDSVTILVTDSGLGGLSIAADVTERLRKFKVFKQAHVVFLNAQPGPHTGYNDMKTTDQKVRIFNNALRAMNAKYQPDLLLIACNTLSVLYDQTDFAKDASLPVVGVVQAGVRLIESKMRNLPNAKVIIFATKTTVNQGKHKALLVKDGMAPERIVVQACPGLAGSIERGPFSEKTQALVRQYVDQALTKLNDVHAPLFASYNCTHYGYVDTLFRQAFKEEGRKVLGYLNPNPYMADFIFSKENVNRFAQTSVRDSVVSQIEISPAKIRNISALIRPVSEQTAVALEHYHLLPHFFEWKSIANE
jgi:glutamate racemase